MGTWTIQPGMRQGSPARVCEKGSVRGISPCSTIHWPVRTCHQVSGSLVSRSDQAKMLKKVIATTRRGRVSFIVELVTGTIRSPNQRHVRSAIDPPERYREADL